MRIGAMIKQYLVISISASFEANTVIVTIPQKIVLRYQAIKRLSYQINVDRIWNTKSTTTFLKTLIFHEYVSAKPKSFLMTLS